MSTVDGGAGAPSVEEDFLTGNFDYYPDVAPELRGDFLPFNQLSRRFDVVSTLPSDELIPELPDQTVESLAQRNLRHLYGQSKAGSDGKLQLFAAVELRKGTKVATDSGSVALKRALILPHDQIRGRIAGPNRRMLDLVYEELGAKPFGEPDTERKEPTAFGGPLFRPDGSVGGGTPAQTLTHRRLQVSRRRNYRVSPFLRRAQFDEVEIDFAGQVDSAVILHKDPK